MLGRSNGDWQTGRCSSCSSTPCRTGSWRSCDLTVVMVLPLCEITPSRRRLRTVAAPARAYESVRTRARAATLSMAPGACLARAGGHATRPCARGCAAGRVCRAAGPPRRLVATGLLLLCVPSCPSARRRCTQMFAPGVVLRPHRARFCSLRVLLAWGCPPGWARRASPSRDPGGPCFASKGGAWPSGHGASGPAGCATYLTARVRVAWNHPEGIALTNVVWVEYWEYRNPGGYDRF